MEIDEVVDATKIKFDEDAAWAMLKSANRIQIAKGKKYEEFTPADGRDVVMKKALGPSGNLRAPAYRAGNDFIIGYNEDLYREWID